MSSSLNDIAWEKLFSKLKIVEGISRSGIFEISASQIKEFREPRLMTKFDHKSQLPAIFKYHGLSILPISRGGYVIAPFQTFKHFEKNESDDVIKIDFPGYLESLDYKNITSESTAINCSFASHILHDFLEEEELTQTVSGRMSSSSFSFDINSKPGKLSVAVANSQIEIDGGFEGVHSLSIIEAKNYISDDFIIRQLYYPYRLWSSKISKPVRPIFLTYTNGIFHLREYVFEESNNYNSILLIRQKKYFLREGAINLETIEKCIARTNVKPEPELPFPQADSFERIVNLTELLKQNGSLYKSDITENYDFDERQTNYYTDAARYLGLVTKRTVDKSIEFALTKEGESLFAKNIYDRQLELVKLIVAHQVFRDVLLATIETGEVPHRDEVVEIMKRCNLYNVRKESTYRRRASTIISWINWIISLAEE